MKRSSFDWECLDRLAETFLQRHRQGEQLSVTVYACEHPRMGEPIQELFPILLALERCPPGPLQNQFR